MDIDDVMKVLEPLAKGLGIAVKEIWGVFVKQYLVKGISQLFSGIVFGVAAYETAINFSEIGKWVFVVIAGVTSLLFVYSSIPLIFNPKYEAIDDIIHKIKTKKSDWD